MDAGQRLGRALWPLLCSPAGLLPPLPAPCSAGGTGRTVAELHRPGHQRHRSGPGGPLSEIPCGNGTATHALFNGGIAGVTRVRYELNYYLLLSISRRRPTPFAPTCGSSTSKCRNRCSSISLRNDALRQCLRRCARSSRRLTLPPVKDNMGSSGEGKSTAPDALLLPLRRKQILFPDLFHDPLTWRSSPGHRLPASRRPKFWRGRGLVSGIRRRSIRLFGDGHASRPFPCCPTRT